MNQTSLTLTIMVAFLVGFPLLWVGVCRLLSLLGGWHSLAQRYSVAEVPECSLSMRGVGDSLGLVRYRGVLNVGASPRGLCLSVALPFRAGHPSLLIPWSDLARVTEASGLFSKTLSVTVRNPEVTVTLAAPQLSAVPEVRALLAARE